MSGIPALDRGGCTLDRLVRREAPREVAPVGVELQAGRLGRGHVAEEQPGTDLRAVVRRARQDGASRVFLVGASLGGAAIVQNTSGLAVDGRISLSGTRLWRGLGVNNPAAVHRLRAQFLYLGTKRDPAAPVPEARRIFRAVGSLDKRAVFYRGSHHGTQLVGSAPFAARARALVLAWIRARS